MTYDPDELARDAQALLERSCREQGIDIAITDPRVAEAVAQAFADTAPDANEAVLPRQRTASSGSDDAHPSRTTKERQRHPNGHATEGRTHDES
jgi:hypothetical protein